MRERPARHLDPSLAQPEPWPSEQEADERLGGIMRPGSRADVRVGSVKELAWCSCSEERARL